MSECAYVRAEALSFSIKCIHARSMTNYENRTCHKKIYENGKVKFGQKISRLLFFITDLARKYHGIPFVFFYN